MWATRMRRTLNLGLVAILGLCSSVTAAEVIAFVAEVSGAGQVVRAAGAKEPLEVGAQLFEGDKVKVKDGRTNLVFLSGRSVKVKAGDSYAVKGATSQNSALVSRIAETLGEIAGPQSELDRPAVHGMAREMGGLHGALPANTRLLEGLFAFSWDPLPDLKQYEFTLETSAGGENLNRKVHGTEVAAHLQAGKRYHWSVSEEGDFVPRTSGRMWVEVVTDEEAEAMQQALDQLEKEYAGRTLELMRLAALFREGYYFEVARLLGPRAKDEELDPVEKRLLAAAFAKMERWERLQGPPRH
jgi:hypothetical protein